jgi:hypothetical protein
LKGEILFSGLFSFQGLEMNEQEKKLLELVKKSMREVKKGTPLKDYMDDSEIERALCLLVKVTKPKS